MQERCKDVKILPITNPPVVKAAGQKQLTCTSMVFLDLQIRTAARPVNVHNVKCYVLEKGDDQFMLGRDVLEALVINVKSALEQLANTSIELNRDDLPNEPEVGDLIDEKVNVELKRM
ncbi:uncharacterized protein PHALS_11866 [Plasmopara halstedii]|uniref:Uncharacterized protein n=1 Tax=Plasmopara halstedii TaxID=4781 RepID=A0A0P1AKR3_PLAHL|nr:uncharacterized protein PHALS_11866 [Plasmopara halstedii]CEG41525.1 hypothetical protein PHALS_11866 [Plasmopara halstedii]|eukprot:XP_024577894.1 hypothetical protein PHALS_11866 [Plasmopara halstedii]